MKILWLTWKDHLHPGAGGAEVVLFELSKRLVKDGHEVTWLTCGYQGASKKELKDGVEIIRVGTNRYLHSIQALVHYLIHMRKKFDISIEVVNTAPYFHVFFDKHSIKYLFYHQLARDVWFYEISKPVSQLGYYLIEPLSTRLLGRSRATVLTVSGSTRQELIRFGFKKDRIHIIHEGIEIEPVLDIESSYKFLKPTMLSFGSMRAMKRTLDQITAFEIAKNKIPDLQLKIAGDSSGTYGGRVLDTIIDSPHFEDIEYVGKVSKDEKISLMRASHVILQTSVKEGWGLTITEAASQGTPAVVYDVDGLRDSVINNVTGIITEPRPEKLAEGVVALLTNSMHYRDISTAAWQMSKQYTFDQSYEEFKKVLAL